MLKKLFLKSLLYFGTLAGGKLLTAVLFIFLARVLQPEKFGEISFFLTITQIITVIADAGLKSWYQKAMARQPRQQLLGRLTAWRAILAGGSIFGVSIAHWGWGWLTELAWEASVITLGLEALVSVADAYYLARGETLRLGGKLILRNLLLFTSLLVIHSPIDGHYFYWFYTGTLALVVAIYVPWRAIRRASRALISQSKWIPPGVSPRLPVWRQFIPPGVLAQASVYAVIDDLGIAYSRADQLVIETLAGSAALGIYSAAYRFVDAFNLLPQALFHNLFPVAARRDGLSRRQIAQMVAIMTGLGLIVALGLLVTSDWLTVWLLGESYREAGRVLRAFAGVIVLFFFNAPLNTVLQSSDQVRRYVPFLAATTAVNLALNFYLLPHWGLLGSVAAMAAAEGLLVVINLWLVARLTAHR